MAWNVLARSVTDSVSSIVEEGVEDERDADYLVAEYGLAFGPDFVVVKEEVKS